VQLPGTTTDGLSTDGPTDPLTHRHPIPGGQLLSRTHRVRRHRSRILDRRHDSQHDTAHDGRSTRVRTFCTRSRRPAARAARPAGRRDGSIREAAPGRRGYRQQPGLRVRSRAVLAGRADNRMGEPNTGYVGGAVEGRHPAAYRRRTRNPPTLQGLASLGLRQTLSGPGGTRVRAQPRRRDGGFDLVDVVRSGAVRRSLSSSGFNGHHGSRFKAPRLIDRWQPRSTG